MKRKVQWMLLIMFCTASMTAGYQDNKPKTLAFPEQMAREYRDSLTESEKLGAIKAAIEARISVEQERQQRIVYQAALKLGLTQEQIEKASISMENGPRFVLDK